LKVQSEMKWWNPKLPTPGAIAALLLACLLAWHPFTVNGAEECGPGADETFQAAATPADFAEFVAAQAPCELAFVAVQRLAAPYLLARDWPGAAGILRRYRGSFPEMGQRFDRIVALLEAKEEKLTAVNPGSPINTPAPEYRPVVAADGRTLLFTRDRGKKNGGEDVYMARKQGLDWTKPENLGPPVSTGVNEMATGVAADNTTLVLFGNYPGTFGRGDLFQTRLGEVCDMEIIHYPAPVNSEYYDGDGMLTADNRAMFLVSDRPGGVGEYRPKEAFFHGGYGGNTDIYIQVSQPDGSSALINPGGTINTPYAEYSPFLHPDGKTLYFSSEGHAGLGGLDVFKATRLSDDSWTEWSEPVNLGKEINTPYNDWGYQIATDGSQAFFASGDRPGGFGASDIYVVPLPDGARPGAVVAVFGRVTDPAGNGLEAELRWNDLTLGRAAGTARTDRQTGEYYIALPAGHRYGYSAEKEGYMGRSETLDFTGIDEYTERRLDIVLYPIEQLVREQSPIELNNVFFDFDKYDLRPESALELERWVELLKKKPALRAAIHGHTDHIGPEAYNEKLSAQRAGAVAAYLRQHGVAPDRLTVKGFGETRPVADNDTKEGRQRNRRVEIRLSE